jgi:hypothetical protein
MIDKKNWASAWARFEAFRSKLSTSITGSIKEESVKQYHSLLADLESCLGESLEKFRIPDDKVTRVIVSSRPRSYSGMPGGATLSRDRYCDSDFFGIQVDGLHAYLRATVEAPASTPQPESGARRAAAASHIVHVENMIGSSIQQGSPGAVAHVNYEHNDPQLRELLTTIKDSLSSLSLSAPLQTEINSDIATIEAQLVSPRPKGQVITDCLRSIEAILEGTAGSMVAYEILKFLGAT